MTALWLIRHAEADWNRERRYLGWSDRPLTEAGRAASVLLGRRLRALQFDALYTSDLIRATETAAIALPALPATQEPDLRELNFGIFEGLTYAEAQTAHRDMLAAWIENADCPPTGGEALTTLGERVGRFMKHRITRTEPRSIGVIAHGGSLRVLLCLALSIPIQHHWQFQLDSCSISRLDLYPDGAALSLLNDTHHLEHSPC